MAEGTDGFASTEIVSQRKACGYNIAAPGANTNILTSNVTFGPHASACRVLVVLATSSVFNYKVTDGTTAFTVGLNASNALNAGDAYEFTFAVSQTDDGTSSGTSLAYNFQVETDSIIRQIIVDELTAAVG